jgi:hypothetical protein
VASGTQRHKYSVRILYLTPLGVYSTPGNRGDTHRQSVLTHSDPEDPEESDFCFGHLFNAATGEDVTQVPLLS